MAVTGAKLNKVRPVGSGQVTDVRKSGKAEVAGAKDHVVISNQPKATVAQRNLGGVAGRSLDAMKSKLLGGDPAATLMAKLDGVTSDQEAAAILGEAFKEIA